MDKSKKKDAVKKVIAAMTVGKDVSPLFPGAACGRSGGWGRCRAMWVLAGECVIAHCWTAQHPPSASCPSPFLIPTAWVPDCRPCALPFLLPYCMVA